MFSSRFMLFPTFLEDKKCGEGGKKIVGGGGGLEKHTSFSFHVFLAFCAIFFINF